VDVVVAVEQQVLADDFALVPVPQPRPALKNRGSNALFLLSPELASPEKAL
jgi:hypothetical protein